MFDENVAPMEHTRGALHRSIDRICAAWPQALEDANARGYTATQLDSHGSAGTNTAVEGAALNPSKAVAWLAELHDVITALAASVGGRVRTWDVKIVQYDAHLDVEGLCNTWPAKAEHITRTIVRLANAAAVLWPALRSGQPKPAKAFDNEICLYCGIGAYLGDRKAVKSPDGVVEGYAHKTPCWYALTVSRARQHQMVRITPSGHT